MWGRAEFRGAVLALGGVLAVVLTVTSITPGLPGELLLQTLRFHLVALGLLLAVFMVLFGAKWRAGLFLAFLGVAFAHGAYLVWEFGARREAPVGALQAEMTLLNYNVLSGNKTPRAAVDFIVDFRHSICTAFFLPVIPGKPFRVHLRKLREQGLQML